MKNQLSDSPKTQQEGVPHKLHAIQLVAVQPLVLSVSVQCDPEEMKNFEGSIQLESSHSEYDEENKVLQVKVRALIPEECNLPLSLHVEIVGAFKVDESQFRKDDIDSWARKNAPLVLYPFLREQVFSLSVRVGAPGLIIPLIEVPTFKVVAPNSSAASSLTN